MDFYCSCFASKVILRKNKSGLVPDAESVVVLKEQTTQEGEERI